MNKNNSKIPEVKMTFGVEMMDIINKFPLTPEAALAEFIDNSIQSYVDKKKYLKRNQSKYILEIDIVTDKELITIKDNAGGIHNKDWSTAFKTGNFNKDTTSKNEFGAGMKLAAIWFSPLWAVFTKAIGEDFAKSVQIDQKNMIKSNNDTCKPKPHKSRSAKTFTHIILHKVHHPINKATVINKIQTHIASIFRNYVNNKDIRIRIGSTKKLEIIKWEPPEIQRQISVDDFLYKKSKPKKHIWKIDVKFSFGIKKRYKVDGWVGVLAKGDTKNISAGLFYFRRGRCIYLNVKPSEIFGSGGNTYVMQRITGELYFNNEMPISVDKKRFVWDPIDEEDFIKKLKEKIDNNKMDIIDQATRWKRDFENKITGKKTKKQHSLEKSFNENWKESIVITDDSYLTKNAKNTDPKKIFINQKTDEVINFKRINYKDKAWTIKIVKHWGSETNDWLQIADPKLDSKQIHITIRIAMNHNFVRTYFRDELSKEGLLHLACYMVLSEVAARNYLNSKNPSAVRYNINKILKRIPPEKPTLKKFG